MANEIGSPTSAEGELHAHALSKRRLLYQHLSSEVQNLSFFVRHVYCAPQFATLPVVTLLSVYLTTFYQNIGAGPAYVSFFIALARSLDVLSDPLMSYATDSFRSSFGRRRPFCFVGCWIYAVWLILLLSPPASLSTVAVSYWFGITYVGFFLSNTFLAIPYDALGPELTDNYEDRSLLFFTAGMYDGVGALLAIILPNMAGYFSTSSCDSSTCFSTTGVGHSCLNMPGTTSKQIYNIFNATAWSILKTDDMAYSSPTLAFQQQNCNGEYPSVLNTYCQCIEDCASLCTVHNSRTAYKIVGIFFGVWIVGSMCLMVYWIRERSQLQTNLKLEESAPLIPSLLNTLRNRAFVALLPAWTCDAIALAMVASMMAFFVQYIIEPEFQTKEANGIDCNNGVPIKGEESNSWMCKSTDVLGAIVAVMLVSAFTFIPVWLYLVKR